ncbi:hypothetical protein CC79DRAFT_1336640 [Sarocladium strictum]
MGVWETDDEYLSGPAAVTLPTPQDTPYRTPSRTSRKSRRSITPPAPSLSPALMPSEKSIKRASMDVATDETISPLDPRRFTPTLHANLVSEILALRRDQEEKTKHIESLESTLQTTREEHGTYQENLLTTAKENRSLKRQLALLEGGTSSALGELARERDEAVDSVGDVKKRLEAAQRKVRNQEEDSQRMHDLWAQDKDSWEEERRKFERKIHVAESRLKVVLEEVEAFQTAQVNGMQNGHGHGHESDVDESGRENDAASVRTMSMTNSIRFSVMSGPGAGKVNGHSLADELNFDGDDDDQTDIDGRESAMSYRAAPSRHGRNLSRDSVASRMHRRNMSMESSKRPGSSRGRVFVNQAVLEALEGEDEESKSVLPTYVPTYTDTGVQFSPPPSPKLAPVKTPSPEPPTEPLRRGKTPEPESSARGDSEIEANQRRKRVQLNKPLIIEPPAPQQMVSAGSQTVEGPLSPPKTPKSPYRSSSPALDTKQRLMIASGTQTEDLPLPAKDFMSAHPPPPVPMQIPSINVHPPTSRPTTPREPRLPQYFKHFGCQVNFASSTQTTDVGIQTEGIQIDKRLALLPAHLQPSSITSRPSSPNVQPPADLDKAFNPVPSAVPPRNPRRLVSKETTRESVASGRDSEELHDAYPGNNDDGPLSDSKAAPIKRPHRFSSLFAGFDTASSDEADEFGDVDLSDSEFRTALSAPRPLSTSSKPGNRNSFGTAPTSPEEPAMRASGFSSARTVGTETYSSYNLTDKETFAPKAGAVRSGKAGAHMSMPLAGSSNRASVMRKAAMIQSGIASHQGRSRSPSLPDTKNPPFPIPTRASSRKPPISASAPSDGQRSPTGTSWQRRGSQRDSYRPPSIRKVRSAAALPRSQRYRRHGSRSPPPLSPSTEAPESPALPPMPRNDITTPRTRERPSSQYRRHRHELSTNTDNTNPTDPLSLNGAAQNGGVVDAIAQTMVGEWMYKYVRRRKSFAVESQGKDDSSNDRHKRWVWLAPYERAILWSSKQPSSGSALMGKTGRKREFKPHAVAWPFRSLTSKVTIQSVLDVKDDNPAPKGMTPIFNRSILILTPQRALKFTASSSERHYVWLTALSFLAHSQQAVPEIVNTVPQLKPEPIMEFEPPKTKPKRGGIRDSIRLAKGRTAPSKAAVPSIPSLPSAPSSQMGDVSSFRVPESLGTISTSHTREQSRDAAEPPMIPRFHDRISDRNTTGPLPIHSRKRSNTGGHVPPPLSFRGFSGPATHHNSTNSTAGNSVGTAGSSDIYQSQGSSAGGNWGMSQTASQRTSEASSRPGNFFDAIGTVRMEAFISPLGHGQDNGYPDEQQEIRHMARRRSKEMRRRRSRSRQRDSYSSRGGRRGIESSYGGGRTVGEEDYFRDDPFRGF